MFGRRDASATPASTGPVLPPKAAPSPARPSLVAPTSDTSPSAPFKLRTVSLPNSSLAFTNRVYVSSKQTNLLVNGKNTYFIIENKAVFCVDTSDAVSSGEIAMSSLQRDSFGFAEGSEVLCATFDVSKMANQSIVQLMISATYLKAAACTIQEDDMIAAIKERYKNQVFATNQSFAVDMAGRSFKLTVTELYTIPPKSGDKKVAKADSDDGSPEDDLLYKADRGILNLDGVKIYISPVKNKFVTWHPSAKNKMRSVFKQSWNFQEMGIGGLDNEFQTIFRRAFASRLFPADIIQQLGMHHVRGILLYGPPGTGKTLIARQIGKILNAREPKIVNGPEILNRYVGAAEEAIRALFKDAEDDYKANGEDADLHMIIFDEIDAICKTRGSTRDNTGVMDTIVNQLLSKLDGVNSLNNILVIGMTNRKDLLDEALLRPGRLEVHVEISLPDKKGRKQILEIHTKKMRDSGRLDPDIDFDELAEVTKNFSGAEIEGLVRAAISYALYAHVDPRKLGSSAINFENADDIIVTMKEFRMALDDVKPAFGVSEDELKTFVREPLINYGPAFEEIMRLGREFVGLVKNGQHTRLLSVLLEGPVGSGKTAIAAQLALDSSFPYVRIVSPDGYVGYSENSRLNLINKVFEDAYKSPLSIVILDNIERLIEYTPIGPRFSNVVLQGLMVLLQRIPMNEKRRLLILATTSNVHVLDELQMRDAFNFCISVPQISNGRELKKVFAQRGVFLSDGELDLICKSCSYPISVKQLLLLVDMAGQDGQPITAQKFLEAASYLGAESSKALKAFRSHDEEEDEKN